MRWARWENRLAWAFQLLLVAAFLGSGGQKLLGTPFSVAVFEQIGVGQWFRYVTAILEVAGALALLGPALRAPAAIFLALMMAVAVGLHLSVLGGSFVPALALGTMAALVAVIRRDELRRLAPRR